MFVEIEKKNHSALPILLNTLSTCASQKAVDRPEGAEWHQFLWVVEGCCRFTVDGETYLLSKGEGMFTRDGYPHSYSGESLKTAWCTFHTSDELLDYMGVGSYLYFRTPAFLEKETDQLMQIATGNSTPLLRSAATYAYVTELFSAILSEKETVSVRLRRLLEQRHAEPLTLTTLAEELGVNRFTLCRLYKNETGSTVMEDLTAIRIRKAKKLLLYSADNVEEIGRACGFESPSYFTKRFKEAVGCSPMEYRRARG